MTGKTIKNPTKQGMKKRKPSVGRGGVPTPPGFEAHPERRHNGAWRKEDTLRYKWEKILEMDDAELKNVIQDPKCGRVEKMTAEVLLDGAMKSVEKIAVLEKLATQVYGQPKQMISAEVAEVKPLVDLTKRKKNGSSN